MKLPNAENAAVQREKVADYLLNAAHPDNGGKAAFFEALGFHRAEPERVAKALKDLARQTEVAQTERRRMAESMSSLDRSNRPLAERRPSRQFGLSTRGGMRLGWLLLIHTEDEG